jgi:hypothetical protein
MDAGDLRIVLLFVIGAGAFALALLIDFPVAVFAGNQTEPR